jgi:hypothetical protein
MNPFKLTDKQFDFLKRAETAPTIVTITRGEDRTARTLVRRRLLLGVVGGQRYAITRLGRHAITLTSIALRARAARLSRGEF